MKTKIQYKMIYKNKKKINSCHTIPIGHNYNLKNNLIYKYKKKKINLEHLKVLCIVIQKVINK